MSRTHQATPGPTTVLRLDELSKKALAGEGNYLFLVRHGDEHVVVKIYYGSRSRWLYLKKTVGNVLLTGRSSHMPRARRRTEVACVKTWQGHGFRCFGMRPEIEVEGYPREGYMVFDYLPGMHFRDYFRNDHIDFEERMATWRSWIPEWHRRHRIAVETKDPRLIQENGDVKHVMLWEGDFVYFDFEMIFTSKNVRMLVGREILAYMRSAGRFFGEKTYDRMMDELVLHYPDKALLFSAYETAWRHTNPFMRFFRMLDRALKPSNRKRFSKYTVALDLEERLHRISLAN